MRFLVQFPTRGRPEQAAKCYRVWLERLSGKHEVSFRFQTDRDDPTVNQTATAIMEVDTAFRACRKACDVHGWGGSPRTKVQAINSLMPAVIRDFDIIILASDDMWPEVMGFDEIIAREMELNFPDLDGVLHFNDGYRGAALNTLPIVGRNYYNQFGYLYHPSYRQSFCDNEMQEVSKSLGKAKYFEQVLILHVHPFNDSSIPEDETYIKANQKSDAEYDRRNRGFRYIMAGGGYNPYAIRSYSPPGVRVNTPDPISISHFPISVIKDIMALRNEDEQPVLSVLIATSELRHHQFRNLLFELARQRMLLGDPSEVEILTFQESGEMSLGMKRNKLVKASQGKYICFIDDDDWVEPDYLWSLVKATAEDADCIVFNGVKYIEGAVHQKIVFDMNWEGNREEHSLRLRTPNHLTPIRRSIAVQVPFPSVCPGEDIKYAGGVYPLIKSQAAAVDAFSMRRSLYHYYWSPTHTLTNKRPLFTPQ